MSWGIFSDPVRSYFVGLDGNTRSANRLKHRRYVRAVADASIRPMVGIGGTQPWIEPPQAPVPVPQHITNSPPDLLTLTTNPNAFNYAAYRPQLPNTFESVTGAYSKIPVSSDAVWVYPNPRDYPQVVVPSGLVPVDQRPGGQYSDPWFQPYAQARNYVEIGYVVSKSDPTTKFVLYRRPSPVLGQYPFEYLIRSDKVPISFTAEGTGYLGQLKSGDEVTIPTLSTKSPFSVVVTDSFLVYRAT